MLGEAVVLDVGTKGFVDNCNEMGKWAGIGNQRMLADHLLYHPRQFGSRGCGVSGNLPPSLL